MSGLKLALYGTPLLRNLRTKPPLTTKLNHHSSFPFLFFKQQLHRASSFSTTTTAAAAVETVHPWPEWISFVDRLTSKGYLSKSDDDTAVYSNFNLLKDASLCFARDRYDLFKLLSSEDIQAVVAGGCPNLLRKAVNSAKRLRAHLRLEEGDVCSACNLRESCDRAYVILQESEADARTVDIVRILLFYAIDPLVLSGGEKPLGREVIESSVRKLISQLIELSESSPPPPPVPAHSNSTAQDAVAKGKPRSFRADMLSKTIEMKEGDWMCSKCNFMNFARNTQCLNCEKRPKKVDSPTIEMKPGDWMCSECNFLNFARNIKCLKCQTEGPKRVNSLNTNEVEMKKGDWICPQCGVMNFSRNVKCLKCPEPRPVKHPGEWICPKCDFYNYARNTTCLKCNTNKPQELPTNKEERIWRSERGKKQNHRQA